jgi:hypothetical protein
MTKSPAVSTATQVMLHKIFADYWTPNLKSSQILNHPVESIGGIVYISVLTKRNFAASKKLNAAYGRPTHWMTDINGELSTLLQSQTVIAQSSIIVWRWLVSLPTYIFVINVSKADVKARHPHYWPSILFEYSTVHSNSLQHIRIVYNTFENSAVRLNSLQYIRIVYNMFEVYTIFE